MRPYAMSLAACLIGLFSNAQTITGSVMDERQRPLENVTIRLKRDTAVLMAVTSDSSGNFTLCSVPSGLQYTLSFSFIGYRTIDTSFLLSADLHIQTTMTLQAGQLKAAVVTGRKRLIERKIDRLVFNVENNISTTGMDALDLLGKTPLVRVDNGTVTLVGKNALTIMIDGKIVHLSGQALTTFLKGIMASTVSSIEVVTNPPAQYDAEGNSGMINIVTKHTRAPGFSGSAVGNFSAASYNAAYEGVNLNYNFKDLLLFGGLTFAKGAHEPTYGRNTFYSDQTWYQTSKTKEYTDFTRGNFGFEWLLSPRTTLGMSYDGSGSRPGDAAHTVTKVFDKASGALDSTLLLDNNYDKKFTDNSANLHFTQKLDTLGKDLVVDADYFHTRFDNGQSLQNSNFFPDGESTPGSAMQYLSVYDQNTTGYSLNAVVDIPIHRSTLSFGGKATQVDYTSDVALNRLVGKEYVPDSAYSDRFKYNESIQALFANFHTSFGKFQLQAGLRAERTSTKANSLTLNQKNDSAYFNVFPTLYLTWQPNGDNTFSLNYGRRIGRPGYAAFNPFRVYQSVYYYGVGDPGLKPSFSDNIEFSHVFKNILSTQLSYSRTTSMAGSVGIVENGSNQTVDIVGNFFSATNYTFSETFDLIVGKWLESVNEASVFYTKTHSTLAATAPNVEGAGGDFRTTNNIFFNKSKTWVGDIDFTYVFPSVSGIENFKRYYYLDLSARYVFPNKKFNLTAQVRDVFRTKNVAYSELVNQILVASVANNDSRRFVISATWSFGNAKMKKGRSHSEIGEEQGRSSR